MVEAEKTEPQAEEESHREDGMSWPKRLHRSAAAISIVWEVCHVV